MTTQPGQTMCPAPMQIEIWPIERLRQYPRNPRKNDAAVDRMCASIREFGFKIPVPGSQRRRGRRRASPAEGRAQARHYRDPGDPLRRMDAGAGQSVPAYGEPLGDLGRLGRRAPGAGTAGDPGVGLRSVADWLRPGRDRRPAGARRRRESERRAAAAGIARVATRRSVAPGSSPCALRRRDQRGGVSHDSSASASRG